MVVFDCPVQSFSHAASYLCSHMSAVTTASLPMPSNHKRVMKLLTADVSNGLSLGGPICPASWIGMAGKDVWTH